MLIFPPALSSSDGQRDLVLYALHRLASPTLETLVKVVGIARAAALRTLDLIRRDRLLERDAHGLLCSLEWTLCWQLRAATHRPGSDLRPSNSS